MARGREAWGLHASRELPIDRDAGRSAGQAHQGQLLSAMAAPAIAPGRINCTAAAHLPAPPLPAAHRPPRPPALLPPSTPCCWHDQQCRVCIRSWACGAADGGVAGTRAILARKREQAARPCACSVNVPPLCLQHGVPITATGLVSCSFTSTERQEACSSAGVHRRNARAVFASRPLALTPAARPAPPQIRPWDRTLA